MDPLNHFETISLQPPLVYYFQKKIGKARRLRIQGSGAMDGKVKVEGVRFGCDRPDFGSFPIGRGRMTGPGDSVYC